MHLNFRELVISLLTSIPDSVATHSELSSVQLYEQFREVVHLEVLLKAIW
jgi:predicted HTH domain antitoxin